MSELATNLPERAIEGSKQRPELCHRRLDQGGSGHGDNADVVVPALSRADVRWQHDLVRWALAMGVYFRAVPR
jgi:hypothetical protein